MSDCVRCLDNLGRVVLPIDMRKTLGIEKKDQIQISIIGKEIIIKKAGISCVFCGGHTELKGLNGKFVCKNCEEVLKEQEPIKRS